MLQLQYTGHPTPSFEWLKNGFPVSKSPLASEYQLRENSLVVDRVKKHHAGTYTCKVKNIAGEYLWLEATINIQ